MRSISGNVLARLLCQEFHDQTGEFISLKVCIQRWQERVIKALQDFSFSLSTEDLLATIQRGFVHNFHGKILLTVAPDLCQVDTPNITATKPFEQSEVVQA